MLSLNFLTPIPQNFAATKCPSSCTVTAMINAGLRSGEKYSIVNSKNINKTLTCILEAISVSRFHKFLLQIYELCDIIILQENFENLENKSEKTIFR